MVSRSQRPAKRYASFSAVCQAKWSREAGNPAPPPAGRRPLDALCFEKDGVRLMLAGLRSLQVSLALLVLAQAAAATTVYKTVDADGRVSFSDNPPLPAELADAAAAVQGVQIMRIEVLDYSTPASRPSPLDSARLEAMRETTDRMAADRRERETHRARLRAEAEAARAAANTPRYPTYDEHYYSVHPVYPVRTIVRRGTNLRLPLLGRGHHRLGHVRPPLLPAQRDVASRYNEYPANLVRKHYRGVARREFYGR
jgi:hypothetical protein